MRTDSVKRRKQTNKMHDFVRDKDWDEIKLGDFSKACYRVDPVGYTFLIHIANEPDSKAERYGTNCTTQYDAIKLDTITSRDDRVYVHLYDGKGRSKGLYRWQDIDREQRADAQGAFISLRPAKTAKKLSFKDIEHASL